MNFGVAVRDVASTVASTLVVDSKIPSLAVAVGFAEQHYCDMALAVAVA